MWFYYLEFKIYASPGVNLKCTESEIVRFCFAATVSECRYCSKISIYIKNVTGFRKFVLSVCLNVQYMI